MSSSWSSGSLNLLSLPTKPARSSLMVKSRITQPSISKSNKARMQCSHCGGESVKQPSLEKSSLAIHFGALLAFIEQPALAVTGENNYEDDLTWTLISSAIVAFWYLLVIPPIILNWLRLRWYKRNLLEMYLQFMCVFLFFPGKLKFSQPTICRNERDCSSWRSRKSTKNTPKLKGQFSRNYNRDLTLQDLLLI